MKVTTRTVKKEGARNVIEVVETEKQLPPDTSAASLWLRNRNPIRWKARVDPEPDKEIEIRIVNTWGEREDQETPGDEEPVHVKGRRDWDQDGRV